MIKEMFRLEIPGKSCPQFYSCAVTAGFPSPADDYIENKYITYEIFVGIEISVDVCDRFSGMSLNTWNLRLQAFCG